MGDVFPVPKLFGGVRVFCAPGPLNPTTSSSLCPLILFSWAQFCKCLLHFYSGCLKHLKAGPLNLWILWHQTDAREIVPNWMVVGSDFWASDDSHFLAPVRASFWSHSTLSPSVKFSNLFRPCKSIASCISLLKSFRFRFFRFFSSSFLFLFLAWLWVQIDACIIRQEALFSSPFWCWLLSSRLLAVT